MKLTTIKFKCVICSTHHHRSRGRSEQKKSGQLTGCQQVVERIGKEWTVQKATRFILGLSVLKFLEKDP